MKKLKQVMNLHNKILKLIFYLKNKTMSFIIVSMTYYFRLICSTIKYQLTILMIKEGFQSP